MVDRTAALNGWREIVEHPVISYESPAMRERIERGSMVSHHEEYPPKKPTWETLLRLSRVATAFMAQKETEVEVDLGATREDIDALRDMDDQRALASLIVALQKTGTKLESFSCLGLDSRLIHLLIMDLHGDDLSTSVPCISISWFETRTVLTDGFAQTLLPPLRRLALGLVTYDDTSPQQRKAANINFLAALRSAVNLEVLELRGGISHRWVDAVRADVPFIIMRPEYPFPFTRLRKLVLSKFTITRRDFEQVILPGCFDRGVRTLQLHSCTINGARDMDGLAYWRYLVSKDITSAAAETETETKDEEIEIEKKPNPTPWPYDDDSDDRTSFYSDDSDYDEREYIYEYKDSERMPFVDIDFGFDIEDSDSEHATDSDLSDDDDIYVPWKDDVRMAASALPPRWDPWQWYSKHYYDECVCAYDEEYLADTADMMDVVDELPAPRFDAMEARGILEPLGADVELLFKGRRLAQWQQR